MSGYWITVKVGTGVEIVMNVHDIQMLEIFDNTESGRNRAQKNTGEDCAGRVFLKDGSKIGVSRGYDLTFDDLRDALGKGAK